LKDIVNQYDPYGYKNSVMFYYHYIQHVARHIQENRINNVIVFQTFPFCYWVRYYNPDVKILYHIGNHELGKDEDYYGYFNIKEELAREVLPKIDAVIGVSDAITIAIQRRFPGHAAKIHTLYPGIDSQLFAYRAPSPSDTVQTAYYGRVVEEKGIHILIQAFIDAFKQNPLLRLTITGPSLGPNDNETYLRSLYKMAEGYPVAFSNFIPRYELIPKMQDADVFVYPALWDEPLGLAPLEAMCMGICTVVSNNNAGYMELIENGRNAFSYDNNDPSQLTTILLKLASDAPLRTLVGRQGRFTVKNKLNWDDCARETMILMERL